MTSWRDFIHATSPFSPPASSASRSARSCGRAYLPAYLTALGAGGVAVGLFGSLKDLLDSVYQYPGGWLADRFGRRRALMLFTAIAVGGYALYAAASVWPVMFVGLAGVMAWKAGAFPTTFAVIGDSLPRDRRATAFGVQSVLVRLPRVAGAPLGGALIAALGLAAGIRTSFAITIGLGLIVLATQYRFFADDRQSAATSATTDAPLATRGLPAALRQLLLADCLVRIGEGIAASFIVLFVTEVRGVPVARFGMLYAVQQAVAILSYLPGGRLADIRGRSPVVVLTFFFFAAFPFAVWLASTEAALFAAFAVGGLKEIGEPARKSLIVDLAPDDRRARVVGTYYTIRNLLVVPAGLLGGILWQEARHLPLMIASAISTTGLLVYVMTVRRAGTLLILLLSLAVPAASSGQDLPPAAFAHRISEGPVIDGRLDEPAWAMAPEIGGFRQKEPEEGAAASEATVVRVLYDGANLYIGARLADSQPAEVRASELRRDNTLENDDTFAVLLDTYHDHRNAFLFRINARGTRFDALIRNESRYISSDWDEQWTATAVIDDQGWSAEIAIPFKILRFSGAADQTWGVNFERVIKRTNELTYWAGWDRDFDFTHVSQAGHLGGLRDIRQAERLRLRPYAIAGVDRFRAVDPPRDADPRVDAGIDDLKYAITPNLTSDFTLRPDFAQTEVDQQQINLTRFSLFFPEKRQFFIEGADSLRMGVGLLHFGPPPLELFYSRAIGLSENGEPIPLIGGGKLTGKVSGFDVGVINVQTEGAADRRGENFGVARVRKEVLARSYVGAMVTSRQTGGEFNRVAAVDARFVLKRYFNVAGLAARSIDSRRSGRQWAKQLGAEWRDDLVEAGVNYIDVDPAFEPGIGFVRRRDRLLGTRVSLKPRPRLRGVRQFELTPSAVYYHDDGGALASREAKFLFATAFQSGDRLELEAGNVIERLVRPFRISQLVSVIPGRYEWNYAAATLRSFNGRAASGSFTVNIGDFYSGTKTTLQMAGDFRPSKNLSVNPTYTFNDIDLREGAFDTHLFGLRANVSFTTNVLTSAFLQYNSAGELAALQVRLNYIFRTIDNIYLVFNETRFTSGVFDGRSNRSLVVKTTYSIHR